MGMRLTNEIIEKWERLISESGHTKDCVNHAADRAYRNYMTDEYPSPEATRLGLELMNSGLTDCWCDR